MSFEITEAERRLYENILHDLGDITKFLEDDDVKEILVNSNRSLYVDTSSVGFKFISDIPESKTIRIIKSLSTYAGQSLDNQRISLEMPTYKCMNGERFSAQIPPFAPYPSFTLRKKPKTVFPLESYLEPSKINKQVRMTRAQMLSLIESVEPGSIELTPENQPILSHVWEKELETEIISDLSRESRIELPPKNILFIGGPGSGKTATMNSLLDKSININPNQRYVIIEKLMSEVQCRAAHVTRFIANQNVSMQQAVETAMISRPDRIIMGEVKGAEAYDMLKAWNTGTPGGMGTAHANNPLEAYQRVADLCLESGLVVTPWNQIISTINVMVWVVRMGSESGFIKEILFSKGSSHEDTQILEKIKFSKIPNIKVLNK